MTDQSRPDEIRATSFSQARRGYDREEVDQFRIEVAGELDTLIARVDELETGAVALGIADAASLHAELETVSEDVAEILATAKEAAEGLRSRAAADAATWRADADAEARSLRSEAQRNAEHARGDAWEAASDMLTQAQASAADMLERAAEDALFIRAEAEREALRLTGDARRDQDEILRSARTEADRTVDAARVESEQILEAARQSAESAQERARALERRRGELMEELEAARLSIGQLEQEIDTRREALATAADSPDSGVRVVGVGDEYEWQDDDSSVRVVPGHAVPVDEPVDADSLVAEVEALQRAIDAVGAPEPEPEVVEHEGDDDDADVGVIAAPQKEVFPVVDEAAEATTEPDEPTTEPIEAESTPPEDAVAEDAVAGDAVAGDAVPSDEQQPADEEVPAPAEPLPPEPAAEPDEPAPPTSGLDSIFARLREPQEEPPPAVAATPTPTPEVAEEEQPADAPPAAQDEPAPESAPAEPVASPVDVDAFDIRDRLLLPIENRALRSVKRRIVDLQNRVLEELRVGGDEWLPDRAMLAAAVGDEMATLAAESHVAGHTAAADLAGSGTTPRPERGPSGDDSGAFVDALERAVGESLSRTRSAGGGARQTSAGVSRVFRAWRTDEAERRLRHAARRSYHEGVLAGLALLEVSRVVALADGQPCGECPAESGAAWRPDGELPEGFKLPPAGPGCSATIVPAA